MDVAGIIENLVRSYKAAFEVVIFVGIEGHSIAAKAGDGNGVRNPFIENDFKRDRRRP